VVLAWRGGNPARQIEQLQHAGVRVVWIDPQSLDEMIDTVQSLARWSPRPEQAVSAAQALRAQEAALRQRYRHAAPVALFLQFGQQPLFTASCGGQNIFADSRVSWPQVSREQVLIRQPQAIVISGDTAQAASITRFWRSQLSVPVIAINPDWLSRPGPRLLLAAQQLCAALHPLKK